MEDVGAASSFISLFKWFLSSVFCNNDFLIMSNVKSLLQGLPSVFPTPQNWDLYVITYFHRPLFFHFFQLSLTMNWGFEGCVLFSFLGGIFWCFLKFLFYFGEWSTKEISVLLLSISEVGFLDKGLQELSVFGPYTVLPGHCLRSTQICSSCFVVIWIAWAFWQCSSFWRHFL